MSEMNILLFSPLSSCVCVPPPAQGCGRSGSAILPLAFTRCSYTSQSPQKAGILQQYSFALLHLPNFYNFCNESKAISVNDTLESYFVNAIICLSITILLLGACAGSNEVRLSIAALSAGSNEVRISIAALSTGSNEVRISIAALSTGSNKVRLSIAALSTGSNEVRQSIATLDGWNIVK
ncbi:hypothetical protein EJ04DRAFT_169011 [Polyplosphaeria fusca]|uniref:Uncharacterized protein n=1 Tax=Polyplosphaeria fusca TaxID=682080 RepID=A0A9P4QYL1_9PLEO|nr:hypothetical protein EJ04DRAFT_169011 [Polyplosphaeria fusca]